MPRRVLIGILATLPASLACSLFLGGPTYPDPPVPVSTGAASALQSALDQSLTQAAQSGTLTVELTESELTSYLATELARQTAPPITNPQVTLRDGQLRLYGTTQAGVFVANVGLAATFAVDQNGQPQILVTQAEYGPFPAPSAFTDGLSALLAEALTGTFGPAAIGFRLESITVADGKLVLTGRVK